MALIRLLVARPEGSVEIAVSGTPPTSIAELAAALDLTKNCPGLWVDDHWADASSTLDEAQVVDGAKIATSSKTLTNTNGDNTATKWCVEIIGGLRAGTRYNISASAPTASHLNYLTAGGSPKCDIAISGVGWRPQHAQLQLMQEPSQQPELLIHATNRDSTNKTKKAVSSSTPFKLGNALVQISESPQDVPTAIGTSKYTKSGRIAFNRPPRPALPTPPQPIAAPAAEAQKSLKPAAFGWAALTAPLVMGVLMALIYSPYMALFALLSPLMMAASWLDNRRRNRTEQKHSRRKNQACIAEFTLSAQKAYQTETIRLRQMHPHLAEINRRITHPSMRLWERRTPHSDFLTMMIGHGNRPFNPELSCEGSHVSTVAQNVLTQIGLLQNVPITVNLGANNLLGLTGPRTVSTAIARGLLLQAAAMHGPGDLAIVIATSQTTMPAWAWTAWLPHTEAPFMGSARLVFQQREALEGFVAELIANRYAQQSTNQPHLLLLIDGENLATGRVPPLRPLLQQIAGPASAIVLSPSKDQLPAATTTIVEASDTTGIVSLTQDSKPAQSLLASGMSLQLARRTARQLARYEDPEQTATNSVITHHVRLLELLQLQPAICNTSAQAMAAAIVERWRSNRDSNNLASAIGSSAHGTVVVDLATQGPHALVGGTTGSGKSELLRTWVSSLAATYSPTQVNFVLLDYKGGSAFDACACLPHVVGLVTDLDSHLAERALRCLEAELRRREQLLRAYNASDLDQYHLSARSNIKSSGTEADTASHTHPPLARLVVIVDEFAALANELPEFMDALVNVAQRGRSLGMHLVLATQRPTGAVSANIRTNTALRIALRVLDANDSADVLDSPDAASIPRNLPGRAIARFGPGELVQFQSALVSGTSVITQAPQIMPAPDGMLTFEDGTQCTETKDSPPKNDSSNTAGSDTADLQLLVKATQAAWQTLDGTPPRQPWPDPLPTQVNLNSLDARPLDAPQRDQTHKQSAQAIAFGLADDPNNQRQYPIAWKPAKQNLLLVGDANSGPGTTQTTLAIALASRHPPSCCHLYVISSNTQEFSALTALPHCGAVIVPDEQERLHRLITRLIQELEHRQTAPPPDHASANPLSVPLVVTFIQNWGGLAKRLDNVANHTLLTSLERLWAEGPKVGLNMVVAAEQFSTASRNIQAQNPLTVAFQLSDPGLYRQWGLNVNDPTQLPVGRGFLVPAGLEVQIAVPTNGLTKAVDNLIRNHAAEVQNNRHRTHHGPTPVECLPSVVKADVLPQTLLTQEPIHLPVGLSGATLSTVGLNLHRGEHALVLGPARSGKTSALQLLAAKFTEVGGSVLTLGLSNPPLVAEAADTNHSLIKVCSDADDLVAKATFAHNPTLVVIDDAEAVLDPLGHLKTLATQHKSDLHIVAAGNADRLRTAYGHWTAELRFSRTGVLLQPHLLDGDFFNVQLPSHSSLPKLAGRGYLIQNTTVTLLQMAYQ